MTVSTAAATSRYRILDDKTSGFEVVFSLDAMDHMVLEPVMRQRLLSDFRPETEIGQSVERTQWRHVTEAESEVLKAALLATCESVDEGFLID